MKNCTKCKINKDFNSFYNYKKRGVIYKRSYCKKCHNAEVKKLDRNEYYRNYRKRDHVKVKEKCRKKLANKIASGEIIKRDSCEICHNSPTDCHHHDYSKPLDFIELCRRCHSFLHNQYNKQKSHQATKQ